MPFGDLHNFPYIFLNISYINSMSYYLMYSENNYIGVI